MDKKKGVSPVVATVLLIVMVVVLALIVFLWFRGISKESITKFGGTNIELVCEQVDLDIDYNGLGGFAITNIGNVPVYSLNFKLISSGSHVTKDIKDISSLWPATGLRQGGIYVSESMAPQLVGVTEVLIVPILVGTSDSGEKTHICDERHGQMIAI